MKQPHADDQMASPPTVLSPHLITDLFGSILRVGRTYTPPMATTNGIAELLRSAERTKAVIDLQHGSTEEGRLARGAAQTRLGVEA
jgi:hypothetical protein